MLPHRPPQRDYLLWVQMTLPLQHPPVPVRQKTLMLLELVPELPS